MGVDYSAVIYMGKEFGDKVQAEEFYKEHIKLTEDQLKEIEDQGFIEWVEDYGVLDYKHLNHYVSDSNCILGFNIEDSLRNPDQFAENVSEAIKNGKS